MSTPATNAPPLSSLALTSVQRQLDAAVNMLVLGLFFPTLLIPVTIGLFLFSTSALRRRPVFYLNILAILLGLAFGGLATYNMTQSVSGRVVSPNIDIALIFLYFFIPVCIQCVLLVRIVAVYPPRLQSWRNLTLIYGTLSVITIARVINISISLTHIVQETSGDSWANAQYAWDLPYSKVEWFLQLFYDTIASLLFLLRLGRGGALKNGDYETEYLSTMGKRASYSERLRALFWIAVCNFVFPVIFNIIQLVLIFRDNDFVHGAYVLLANIYVEIISVLFATLWCSGSFWDAHALKGANARERERPLRLGKMAGESLPSLKFAHPTDLVSQSDA